MLRRSFLIATFLVAACGTKQDSRPRCSECGMYADEVPAFAAYARDSEGKELRFDAPRCMYAFLLGPRGQGAGSPEVVEHYSGERVAASSVSFVVGSNVTGPMGRDFIPVASEHVTQFIRDHQGRAITAAEIDAEMLRSLSH